MAIRSKLAATVCAFAAIGVALSALWIQRLRAQSLPRPTGQPFAAAYDIRDIIWASRHASHFPAGTSSGPLPRQFTKPPPPPQPIDEAELNRQLIRLITDVVDSDSWTVNGGNSGGIGAADGRLYVVQTPENQVTVRNLLEQLRDVDNSVYYARVYDLSDLQAKDPNLPALVQAKWQEQSPPRLINDQVQLFGSKLVALQTRPEHERLKALIEQFRKSPG